MKNDYVMLFLLGAGIVWFIISNIRMYRFLRSAVQSKAVRTGLGCCFLNIGYHQCSHAPCFNGILGR